MSDPNVPKPSAFPGNPYLSDVYSENGVLKTPYRTQDLLQVYRNQRAAYNWIISKLDNNPKDGHVDTPWIDSEIRRTAQQIVTQNGIVANLQAQIATASEPLKSELIFQFNVAQGVRRRAQRENLLYYSQRDIIRSIFRQRWGLLSLALSVRAGIYLSRTDRGTVGLS